MTRPHSPANRLRISGARMLRAAGLIAIGIGIGFGLMAAAKPGDSTYNPHLFAIGICGLFAFACLFMGYLVARNRALRAALHAAEKHVEDLSDSNWEMKEAEERARGGHLPLASDERRRRAW